MTSEHSSQSAGPTCTADRADCGQGDKSVQGATPASVDEPLRGRLSERALALSHDLAKKSGLLPCPGCLFPLVFCALVPSFLSFIYPGILFHENYESAILCRSLCPCPHCRSLLASLRTRSNHPHLRMQSRMTNGATPTLLRRTMTGMLSRRQLTIRTTSQYDLRRYPTTRLTT